MITAELDSKSQETLNALSNFLGYWEESIHKNLPEELAKKAQEHFIPMLKVRPEGSQGNLERSIRYEIRQTGDGWEVDYHGLFYGIYMDTGNFDPRDVLNAKDYHLGAFPIDARLGHTLYKSTIHGMGSFTKDVVPTHYSEKTVEWLAEGVALEVAYHHVMEFLSGVIR